MLIPKPVVSIVIPCRNEGLHIDALLNSLEAQECTFPWEAIIADGQSDDGTREILAQRCQTDPRFRVVENPEKFVSIGLNRAVNSAAGEIVIRMDAHTEYAPNYIQQCVKVLRETGAANVGGPARTRPTGRIQRAVAAAYHSPITAGGAQFRDISYRGPADTVPYGCWYRETLVKAGLFDEALVRNQDDELNLRLVRNGGRIWQDPDIVSWYQPRDSFKKLFRQYFQYGFWKVEVLRKHKRPASWRHLVPAAFVLGMVVQPLLAGVIWLMLPAAGAMLGTLWLTTVSIYLLACAVASVFAAWQHGWDLLAILPAVFPTFHFSYGLGFLANAISVPFRQESTSADNQVFTSITR